MKRLVLSAGALLLAMVAISHASPRPTAIRKDRAALMIYEGRDRVISLVPHSDSANLALILLHQWSGSKVPVERLANRPCIGVALFSNSDWARLLASGRRPEDIEPSDTPMRKRIYPAHGSDSAAVYDIASRTANVAAAFYAVEEAAITRHVPRWSLKLMADKATGVCSVE